MLETALQSRSDNRPLDMPGLLEVLAHSSARPRYAFMVLNLIAKAAGPNGSAGPLIRNGGEQVTVRDWLCDALSPMGHRDPRRMALVERVRDEMAGEGILPADPDEATRALDAEVRSRVRASGKTNVSRAVSDLVRAGLLFRHYQGYCVDHHNRGGQRQAVYTLSPAARSLLQTSVGTTPSPARFKQAPIAPRFRQASLAAAGAVIEAVDAEPSEPTDGVAAVAAELASRRVDHAFLPPSMGRSKAVLGALNQNLA